MKISLIVLTTLVCLLLWVCPAKGQSTILSGTFNCRSERVKVFTGGFGSRTYRSLVDATKALKKKGYSAEGVDELGTILKATCKNDGYRESDVELANGMLDPFSRAIGEPTLPKAEASWLTLSKRGEAISFKAEDPGQMRIAELIAQTTTEKRCKKITDKPYCIKCRSGVIHCPIKSLE